MNLTTYLKVMVIQSEIILEQCDSFLLNILRYLHMLHCGYDAVDVGLKNNLFLINAVNQVGKFTKHITLHYGFHNVEQCYHQQLGVISGTNIIAEQRQAHNVDRN